MVITNHIGSFKMEPITNKRIIAYVIKQNKYWEPIKFGQKFYMMSFQYGVFEVPTPKEPESVTVSIVGLEKE